MQLGGFLQDWTRWRAYTSTVVHKNPQILGRKRTSRGITTGCLILLAAQKGFERPVDLPTRAKYSLLDELSPLYFYRVHAHNSRKKCPKK